MRVLTPIGYLTAYMQRLSKNKTTDLRKLTIEAGTDGFRLREPFMLYAIFTDKQDRVLQIVHSAWYQEQKTAVVAGQRDPMLKQSIQDFDFAAYCDEFFGQYDKDNIVAVLEDPAEPLALEYHKCWQSYVCKRDKPKRDMEVTMRVRVRVLELQKKYGVTNSQIYNALRLNPGNVNAWLNYGKPTIGRDTALDIFELLGDYGKRLEEQMTS
jgi:hypothetical protein